VTIHYSLEYNFNSVVAKRLDFLPTIKKLAPHLKGKKYTKNCYILQQLIEWLKKKENRTRKKEETHGVEGLRWILPEGRPATSQQVDDLATETHGWVSPTVGLVFFFFFLLLLPVV
jgi:hypothetical protein